MMRLRKLTLVLLAVAICEAGCVSVETPPPTAGEKYSPSLKVDDRSATIYIHNDCDASQYIIRDHVFIDDKEFAFLGYEAYAKTSIAPGQHHIKVSIGSYCSNTSRCMGVTTPDVIEKMFEASPGKTYYFGIFSSDNPVESMSMYGIIPIPSESNVKHNYKNDIIQEDNDKKLHDCGIIQPDAGYTLNTGISK